MRAWNRKRKPKHTTRLKYKIDPNRFRFGLDVIGIATSIHTKKQSRYTSLGAQPRQYTNKFVSKLIVIYKKRDK